MAVVPRAPADDALGAVFRSRRGKPCLVCEGTGWVAGPAVSTPRGAFFTREPCPECLGGLIGDGKTYGQ